MPKKTTDKPTPVIASHPEAFSYIRFSNPAQSEGDSVRRQDELRDAWLKKAGVSLNTSLKLLDEGVSAFTGAHRENPDRNALASFLELVKRGRIPRGSYLIVESLDRLTREHIRPALTLLLNLIDAGVRIVQLLPTEAVYDDKVEPMSLMMAIMELSRGHAESRMKSERVGRAWREKKRNATNGVPITRAIPAWLGVEDDRFVVIPEKAATVRRILATSSSGFGLGAIAKKFNSEGVPPIARAKHWARSSLQKILVSRSVFGEYQPHIGHAGPNRKHDGPPIPNYYPVIVSEDVWHASQKAISDRTQKGGRPSRRVGIFSGILKDARDGGPVVVVNKLGKTHGPTLVSYQATLGVKNAKYVSFPLATFEDAILSRLREIDPAEVLPQQNDSAASRVSILAGKLATLEARVEQIKAQLVGGGELAPLVEVLRTVDTERKATADELAQARQESASPLSAAWGECRSLVDVLKSAPDEQEARTRLRSAIRRVIKEVSCLFVDLGSLRLAAVQLWFDGGSQRGYVIAHLPAVGNASEFHQPSRWEVKSFAEQATKDTLDLRKPRDAAALERVLATIDPKLFEGTPEFRKERVLELKAKKMSLSAIAKELGVTTSTVHRDINGRKPK